MHCIEHNNVIILRSQNFSSFSKLLGIGRSPPIIKITIFIELSPLIIESVSHFMSYNDTDSPVINGIIGIKIKEWRLQNSGRETNFVRARIIISINGLRTHIPLGLIHRFPFIFQRI